MPGLEPLTPSEEALWRALMRIVMTLPRLLDSDLAPTTGLTASEYTTIMCLWEAPNRELRMADLAEATGLSSSRTTRLVDDLQSRGLVAKRASSADGRSNLAKLTAEGTAKLKVAWPVHVASVRRRFFDHIDGTAVKRAGHVLSVVAGRLEVTTTAPAGTPRATPDLRGGRGSPAWVAAPPPGSAARLMSRHVDPRQNRPVGHPLHDF
jgi:DNA-binding MarR family transcriptional regulator